MSDAAIIVGGAVGGAVAASEIAKNVGPVAFLENSEFLTHLSKIENPTLIWSEQKGFFGRIFYLCLIKQGDFYFATRCSQKPLAIPESVEATKVKGIWPFQQV